MNGVRRLLGAASSSSQPPPPPPPDPATPPQPSVLPLFSSKPSATAGSGPSWPPSAAGGGPMTPPKDSPKSTAALFLRKERASQALPDENESNNRSWQSNRSSSNSGHGHNMPISSSPTAFSNNRSLQGTGPNSPSSRTSSPRRVPVNVERIMSRKGTGRSVESEWNPKRSSGQLNTRDELLMSLMASEAVVDSRNYDVLSSEEVEDLKKEHAVLSSRLVAMTKKLALETKIRDAAISLSKVNSAHKAVSKQTEQQLEGANRRVDIAQKELWRVSERAHEVQNRLLEHRSAVLSFSVRNMEKKMSPSIGSEDSGYDSSNRSTLMSPATAFSSVSSSSKQSKFDGAHLFAGHADAIVPKRRLSPESSSKEITSLQERLKEATASLAESSKIQAEMKKELSLLRLEKQEVETMMGMELQTAEDTIMALEKELPRLEELDHEVKALKQEKSAWEAEKQRLEDDAREMQALKDRAQELEMRTSETTGGAEKILTDLRESHRQELAGRDAALEHLRNEMDEERAEWERERHAMEDEKIDDLARLHEEMDRLRDADEQVLQQANQELNNTLNSLRHIIQQFNIPAPKGVSMSPMENLLDAVLHHLDELHEHIENLEQTKGERELGSRELEAQIQSISEKRDALARELEDTRRERDKLKRETLASSTRSMPSSPERSRRTPPLQPLQLTTVTPETSEYGPEVEGAKFIAALQPLWSILPSPEARASKFGGNSSRSFRTATGSPSTANASLPSAGGNNTGSNGQATSLSDLDVRSLKTLYDPRRQQQDPSMPMSPKANGLHGPQDNGLFTLEAFIARVHALIADDRSLIERLVRFAQAHDLLKRNAERAQKLAQDGNVALETYQKQVKKLEERNANLMAKFSVMQEEIQYLNETMERITAEKRDVEALAGEQAEQMLQLSDANNTLSARALTLAEEAATAPEMVRKQLDDCRRQLEDFKRQADDAKKAVEDKKLQLGKAQDEINAMRTAEQGQRIALLDELNTMQTENGQLRAQLRAAKGGR